jgi:hypothetical protein
MVNAERRGFATAKLQPISGVMISFLNIMKHRGMDSYRVPSHPSVAANRPRPHRWSQHLLFWWVYRASKKKKSS